MGYFQRPSSSFKSLEVELDLDEVRDRVEAYIIRNAPNRVFDLAYLRALDVTRLEINTVANPSLRGMAHGSNGLIQITVNNATRYMENSGRSTLNGINDLSPVGVLCHELGHHFEWAVRSCYCPDFDFMDRYYQLALRDAVTPYGQTSHAEDLAEAYRLFMTAPETLREINHERYVLIQAAELMLFANRHYTNKDIPLSPMQRIGSLHHFCSGTV